MRNIIPSGLHRYDSSVRRSVTTQTQPFPLPVRSLVVLSRNTRKTDQASLVRPSLSHEFLTASRDWVVGPCVCLLDSDMLKRSSELFYTPLALELLALLSSDHTCAANVNFGQRLRCTQARRSCTEVVRSGPVSTPHASRR